MVDAVWRGEALGTLLWALQLVELPAYDHPFDPDAVVLVDPADGDLRQAEEIELERESARLWHWRARTTELQAAGRLEPPERCADVRPADRGDRDARPRAGRAAAADARRLPAYGKVYRHLTPEQHAEAHSIALERHHALNWLCGAGSDWDDVPLDT